MNSSREPYQTRPAGSSRPPAPENGAKTLWIIVGVIIVIAIIGIIYGATRRSINNADTNPDSNLPINQTDDTQVMGESVPVTYTGYDVVNLQSFPYRVQVRVRGTVPEGCATAMTPTATLAGKVFTVNMTASKPTGAICTQVVTNVESTVELPVAGLAAGTYTVKVGTLPAKTFTLAANNTIQYTGDK